jgi:hypothetical protein
MYNLNTRKRIEVGIDTFAERYVFLLIPCLILFGLVRLVYGVVNKIQQSMEIKHMKKRLNTHKPLARMLSTVCLIAFMFFSFPFHESGIGLGVLRATAASNQNIGLGHLLKGYNIFGDSQLISANLNNNIFRNNAFDEFSQYCNFIPSKASENITQFERTMDDYFRSWGFEAGVTIKMEIGLGDIFKKHIEQKIGTQMRESFRDSTDSLFYESITWRREAIYDIDFKNIPYILIQSQLNPQFLNDITNPQLSPDYIFNTYGTHFLTEYTMGGWIEAGIFSSDTSSHKTVERSNGLEGTITALHTSEISANEAKSNYRSRAVAYGGSGGLLTSFDPIAAQGTINNWINSFDRVDFWNVTEILTIPGDGNNRTNLEGIWELLPNGNEERRYELIIRYMELALEHGIAFNETFIYKNLNVAKFAEANVDDINRADSDIYSTKNPILISSAEDFARIGTTGYPENGYYIMTNDIDFSNVQGNPSRNLNNKPFTGTFNGNGYTIRNFNYSELFGNRAVSHVGHNIVNYGIFPILGTGGRILNLNADNASIEFRNRNVAGQTEIWGLNADRATYKIGVIVGYNAGGIIENCHVTNSMVLAYIFCQSGNIFTGGVVGYNKGDVRNSSFMSTRQAGDGYDGGTTASIYAGSVGGFFNNREHYCYAGGIAGYSSGTISDSYTHKVILHARGGAKPYLHVGGLAGRVGIGGRVMRSYVAEEGMESSSWVGTPTRHIGKLVGQNLGTLTHCFYREGTPVGTGSSAGTIRVPFLNHPDVRNVFEQFPQWEFRTGNSFPTHREYKKSPVFIVEYPNGKPDFHIGDVIDTKNLSNIMTIHFTVNPGEIPVENITNSNNLRVFHAFGNEQGFIYFLYALNSITYLGAMPVTIEYPQIGLGNPTAISLDMNNLIMEIGDFKQLKATLEPKWSNPQVIWESSDETIVAVNQRGELFALENGEAVITVTSVHDSTLIATCTIKIVCSSCIKYPCECPEPPTPCTDCDKYPCECPEPPTPCTDCDKYPCECSELPTPCTDCDKYPCECSEHLPEICGNDGYDCGLRVCDICKPICGENNHQCGLIICIDCNPPIVIPICEICNPPVIDCGNCGICEVCNPVIGCGDCGVCEYCDPITDCNNCGVCENCDCKHDWGQQGNDGWRPLPGGPHFMRTCEHCGLTEYRTQGNQGNQGNDPGNVPQTCNNCGTCNDCRTTEITTPPRRIDMGPGSPRPTDGGGGANPQPGDRRLEEIIFR